MKTWNRYLGSKPHAYVFDGDDLADRLSMQMSIWEGTNIVDAFYLDGLDEFWDILLANTQTISRLMVQDIHEDGILADWRHV